MVCPHAASPSQIDARPAVDLTIGDFFLEGAFVCQDCLESWSRAEDEAARDEFIYTLVPVCRACFQEQQRMASLG